MCKRRLAVVNPYWHFSLSTPYLLFTLPPLLSFFSFFLFSFPYSYLCKYLVWNITKSWNVTFLNADYGETALPCYNVVLLMLLSHACLLQRFKELRVSEFRGEEWSIWAVHDWIGCVPVIMNTGKNLIDK